MTTDPVYRIVHLSDLHFGREDAAVVAALQRQITAIDPLVIAISGDLTQRARRRQFKEARAFIDALPYPHLVVPGNHDVPLFNLAARILNPLGGYTRHITDDLAPAYIHERVVIVGLDTTRPSRVKEARFARQAVQRICYAVRPFGDDVVKILVAHHPFDPGAPREARTRSDNVEALQVLSDAGIDVFLTGHLHVSSVAHSASRYKLGGRSALIVEAGTATSTRLRESTNAFNVLYVASDSIVVERHDWAPDGFRPADVQSFRRTAAGWIDTPTAVPPPG